MGGARDCFKTSGPTYLSNIHSRSKLSHHERQALVAALVNSVYVAERDRQQGRHGVKAYAPIWWNELGYEVEYFIREPGNQHQNIIVGIVFKRKTELIQEIDKSKSYNANVKDSVQRDTVMNGVKNEDPYITSNDAHSKQQLNDQLLEAPMVLVAFRGTEFRYEDCFCHDVLDNLQMLFLQLHKSTRFRIALESVKHAINWVGTENVSVAGHSLGAALTMLVGRTLALEGEQIDCHLFNPPFPSIPLDQIKKFVLLKHPLNLLSSGIAGLLLRSNAKQEAYESFSLLKDWFPHLYIHAQDPLCSNYLDYFSPLDFLHKIGAGSLSKLIAPFSLAATINDYLEGESKAFHLTPSAHIYIIHDGYMKHLKAHALAKWWSLEHSIEHREINIYADD